MKNKIILLSISGLVIIGIIIFVLINSLPSLDVIGKGALVSFKVVTEELENKIIFDEENNGWSLSAPDNTIRFVWSRDFSKSSPYDALLEFSASPFIKAGLDIDKLAQDMISEEMIIIGTKLGEDEFIYDNGINPYESFKNIVKLMRMNIKYHYELDHYGLDLEDGNMFEWAQDMTNNDKDIVFVLNPEPFIGAGVNPEIVEGWIYTEVPMMKNGKEMKVYKFLKPFDLK